MNNSIKSFVLKLMIFTALWTLVLVLCFYTLNEKYFIKTVFILLPFYFLITIASYSLIYKTLKKSFTKFTNSFMLATSLKLIILLFFLLIYIFTNRTQAVVFIVWYFLFYLAFTIFEVFHLLKLDKNDK